MEAMQGLVERLEQAVGRLELLSAVSHRPPGNCGEINGVNGGVAPSVEAFDKLMNSTVAEFLKKSRILAGDVETHVSTFLSRPAGKDNTVGKERRRWEVGALLVGVSNVWPVWKRV
uniref:Cyclase associated actin cytoskeleton regulatory protein 2 n=1 Tax=Myotis myotis TaxID=51298 RepID=A0A7J7ZTG1_MYOMY|nr:cyclase associated actin cytoskeleton regulatory protein 2 [Myotis myotis]